MRGARGHTHTHRRNKTKRLSKIDIDVYTLRFIIQKKKKYRALVVFCSRSLSKYICTSIYFNRKKIYILLLCININHMFSSENHIVFDHDYEAKMNEQTNERTNEKNISSIVDHFKYKIIIIINLVQMFF